MANISLQSTAEQSRPKYPGSWFLQLDSSAPIAEKNETNVDHLITAVSDAFGELTWETLNDTFLTLQHVMESVMKTSSGIDYALPHMQKAQLKNEGRLPENYICDVDMILQAQNELGLEP